MWVRHSTLPERPCVKVILPWVKCVFIDENKTRIIYLYTVRVVLKKLVSYCDLFEDCFFAQGLVEVGQPF